MLNEIQRAMDKDDITRAFENRWRIKAHLDDAGHIEGAVIPFVSSEHQEEILFHIKDLCRDFFETGVLIAEKATEPEMSLSGKQNALTSRSVAFHQSVFTEENRNKYGMLMLNDFYEYWSEPNKSHTKMRFEMQQTWDLDRRLGRWARNNFNGNRNGNTKPTVEQQRIGKLADILAG